jgi:hypothetical protein
MYKNRNYAVMRSKNPDGGQTATATPSIALQSSNPRNSRKQKKQENSMARRRQAQKHNKAGMLKNVFVQCTCKVKKALHFWVFGALSSNRE